MPKIRWLAVLRFALLVALAASTVLLIEYRHAGDPSFCAAGSGCMKVRLSPYSSLFGVPLPYYGLGAYAALFIGSLVARTRQQLALLAGVATIGGLAGLALLVIQGVAIDAFCKWCVTVDVSGVVAAASAWLLLRQATSAERAPDTAFVLAEPRLRAAWAAGVALAVVAPLVWSMYPVTPPLPDALTQYVEPGRLNVFSFTDFQCPFCRKFHPVLDRVRATNDVHFVRFMRPLPSHQSAMPAALAYACVPDDKKDAMAATLYATPVAKLATAGVDIAAAMGLDRAGFEACLKDARTKAIIDHDIALYEATGGAGLPMTYVGATSILGSNAARMDAAVAAARHPNPIALPVWAMVALIGAVAAALAAWTQRIPGESVAKAPAPGPAEIKTPKSAADA